MAATKTQLAVKVLQKLRVLPTGQAAVTDDTSVIETAYDELYQLYRDDGLITWGSADDIPDEAVRPMVVVLASDMADEFNVPEARVQRLLAQRVEAVKQLKSLSQVVYTSTDTKISNY